MIWLLTRVVTRVDFLQSMLRVKSSHKHIYRQIYTNSLTRHTFLYLDTIWPTKIQIKYYYNTWIIKLDHRLIKQQNNSSNNLIFPVFDSSWPTAGCKLVELSSWFVHRASYSICNDLDVYDATISLFKLKSSHGVVEFDVMYIDCGPSQLELFKSSRHFYSS